MSTLSINQVILTLLGNKTHNLNKYYSTLNNFNKSSVRFAIINIKKKYIIHIGESHIRPKTRILDAIHAEEQAIRICKRLVKYNKLDLKNVKILIWKKYLDSFKPALSCQWCKKIISKNKSYSNLFITPFINDNKVQFKTPVTCIKIPVVMSH